jgi:hypothetical protein
MVGAFTTAAVVNGSFCRPEESVKPVDYMPNHNGHEAAPPEPTAQELATDHDQNMRALRMRLQWKKAADAARHG